MMKKRLTFTNIVCIILIYEPKQRELYWCSFYHISRRHQLKLVPDAFRELILHRKDGHLCTFAFINIFVPLSLLEGHF